MESYTSYFYTLRRLPDFRVKYQLLPQADESSPYILQGTRFDFRYSNDGPLKNSHYMIWPEFEDDGGFTILSKWLPIHPSGTAKMWIINQSLREYHQLHLKVGLVGYMTSGSIDIAICEVSELLNLGML
ncbi:hypothetical protein SAMN05216327_10923 [Dyadobacter sp. SG02]|uniref:hypothetical protein n=1 Tax=Dyadobacter sp. SG02 TaxID=1855291 RepID=UPI0008CB4AB5|nr:hypothetical protein [Dyadobacter sp. SG02]SEJ35989.1 hypothetical protein SAMN05216327_10923 [Dyadobacter sp. SG02]